MEVRLPAGSWTAIAVAAMGSAILAIPLAGTHLLVQPRSGADFLVFAAVASAVVAVVVRTTLLDAWNVQTGLVAAGVFVLSAALGDAFGPASSGGLAGLFMGALALPPIESVTKARRRFGGVHRASVISGAWLLSLCIAGVLLDPVSDEGRIGMLLSLGGFVMAVVVLARGIEGMRATRSFVERVRAGEIHELRLSTDGRAILGPVGTALDYRGDQRAWETVALLP